MPKLKLNTNSFKFTNWFYFGLQIQVCMFVRCLSFIVTISHKKTTNKWDVLILNLIKISLILGKCELILPLSRVIKDEIKGKERI